MASIGRHICRGDIYYSTFPYSTGSEITGTHPVVIVQNNPGNYNSNTVIGVVLTSSKKKESMPTHVILNEPNDPCNGSMAMAEQVFTIDKQRLQKYIGHLCEASMTRIDEAVRQSLSLHNQDSTLMCLCSRCKSTFEGLPHHSVQRVDRKQRSMDTCTYCGVRMGYDYWVNDWNAAPVLRLDPCKTENETT